MNKFANNECALHQIESGRGGEYRIRRVYLQNVRGRAFDLFRRRLKMTHAARPIFIFLSLYIDFRRSPRIYTSYHIAKCPFQRRARTRILALLQPSSLALQLKLFTRKFNVKRSYRVFQISKFFIEVSIFPFEISWSRKVITIVRMKSSEYIYLFILSKSWNFLGWIWSIIVEDSKEMKHDFPFHFNRSSIIIERSKEQIGALLFFQLNPPCLKSRWKRREI